jgi:hypothetical protein
LPSAALAQQAGGGQIDRTGRWWRAAQAADVRTLPICKTSRLFVADLAHADVFHVPEALRGRKLGLQLRF